MSSNISNVIQMVKGDSRNFVATIYDKDGNPFDLTDYAVTLSVKLNIRDTTYIFQKKNALAGGSITQIDVFDPTHGKMRIYFLKTDTEPLRFLSDEYVYDIQIVNGTNVKTPIKSKLKLQDDVTQ
jgi:hypothetical protein